MRKDLNNEINWSVKYVKNAVSLISKMHTDGDYCRETFSCKGSVVKEPGWLGIVWVQVANKVACSCVFDRAEPLSHTCKEDVNVRSDGRRGAHRYYLWSSQNAGWYNAGKARANELLHDRFDRFIYNMGETIKNYWQNSLLDLIPSWQKLEVKIPSSDEMEFQDEEYGAERNWRSMRSEGYRRRRQQVDEEMAVENDSKYAVDEYGDPLPYHIQDYESYNNGISPHRRNGIQIYKNGRRIFWGDSLDRMPYNNDERIFEERYQDGRDSYNNRLPYHAGTRGNYEDDELSSDEFYNME